MTPASIMRRTDWPVADQAMWQALCSTGGLFEKDGPFSHLSEPTLGMIQLGYGKWITWLTDTHVEALSELPQERPTLPRFTAFTESLAVLAPATRHLYTSNVLRCLVAGYPECDWTRHQRVVGHLEKTAQRFHSRRKSGRILAGDMVLATGLEMASHGLSATGGTRTEALQQRNGTLIAFLAVIPLRRRTLAGLRLGWSVLLDGEDILITAQRHDMKTRTPWETWVPTELVPLLRRYINETRPWLMRRYGADHDYLWVTRTGDPLVGSAMGTLVRNQTRKIFGVPVSPHLFRDIAATTLVRKSPEAVGHVRALLGHQGHRTAEAHYNHATVLEAGRQHAKLIERLKAD